MKTFLLVLVLFGAILAASGAPPVGPEYDTLTNLLAHQPIPGLAAKAYTLKGRTAIGDGGGGEFTFIAGSTLSTNMGTRFAWGTGRLIRREAAANAINVQWFGADPTGAVNCRNALQDAFNAAGSTGEVYVPTGNYRLVPSLPIMGVVRRFYGPGKFWLSLPTDYTNPNVYGVNDDYTATNVLNSSGALVSWNSHTDDAGQAGYYGVTPWNGKAVVFQALGSTNGCIIDGLSFDGGWGTTGAPTGVIPVTGISASLNENGFYALFANCSISAFRNCKFKNMPGAVITHLQGPLTIEGCVFEEYGDHIYYNTAHRDGFRFVNNSIVGAREAVSVEGNAAFVAQTYRDAIKLRDCENCVISGNVYRDNTAAPIAQFITLEASATVSGTTYTNDCRNINITGNTVSTYLGIIAVAYRDPAGLDDGGRRLRDIRIANNNFNVSGQVIRSEYLACDGLTLSGNTINLTNSGAVCLVNGSNLYTNAVRNFEITGNYVTSTNLGAPPIRVSGNVVDILIQDNTFIDSNPHHSTALSMMKDGSDLSWFQNALLTDIRTIDIKRNHLINYMALYAPSYYNKWVTGTNYVFSHAVYGDGDYFFNQVVKDPTDGLYYTNKASVLLGVTEPHLDAANWGLLAVPTAKITMLDNDRFSRSTNTSSTGAAYLAIGAGEPMKARYDVTHSGNLNLTTIAQPVSYAFYVPTTNDVVTLVTTNTYSQVDDGAIWDRLSVRGTNAVGSALYVQSGGMRADAAAGNGISLTFQSHIEPTQQTTNPNGDLSIQTVKRPGIFDQYLVYNGKLYGDENAPTFRQGVYQRASYIKFDAFYGGWSFWANQDYEPGSGVAFDIVPTEFFRIRPGFTTNDPPSSDFFTHLNVSSWLSVGGFIRIPNNTWIYGSNALATANIPMIGVDAANQIRISPGGTNIFIDGLTTITADASTLSLAPSVATNASLLVFKDAAIGSARGSVGFPANGSLNMLINVNNGSIDIEATDSINIATNTAVTTVVGGDLQVLGAFSAPNGATNYFLALGSTNLTVTTNIVGKTVTWTVDIGDPLNLNEVEIDALQNNLVTADTTAYWDSGKILTNWPYGVVSSVFTNVNPGVQTNRLTYVKGILATNEVIW